MNNRVLITGISGYLGSNLARRLDRDGSEVHGLIREKSDLSLLGRETDHFQLHTFDGSMECMIEILRQCQPKTVFHLASLFKAAHKTADVIPLIESNLKFGAILLEAMAVTGVRNLVNTGTLWQNYDGQDYNPVALYAATKQGFDDLIRYYTEIDQIRAITLKLTDTYGPEDPRRKLFNLIVEASKHSAPFGMTGGEQLIDLVHVDDVVSAFIHAAKLLDNSSFKHCVRLVSSGSAIQIKTLVATIEKVSGRNIPVVWGQIPYRPREMFKNWQANPILDGWHAEVSLEEGIRSILK